MLSRRGFASACNTREPRTVCSAVNFSCLFMCVRIAGAYYICQLKYLEMPIIYRRTGVEAIERNRRAKTKSSARPHHHQKDRVGAGCAVRARRVTRQASREVESRATRAGFASHSAALSSKGVCAPTIFVFTPVLLALDSASHLIFLACPCRATSWPSPRHDQHLEIIFLNVTLASALSSRSAAPAPSIADLKPSPLRAEKATRRRWRNKPVIAEKLATKCRMRHAETIWRETEEGEKCHEIQCGTMEVRLPHRSEPLRLIAVKGFGEKPLLLTDVGVARASGRSWRGIRRAGASRTRSA